MLTHFLVVLISFGIVTLQAVDPFSHITITSEQANCQPDKENKNSSVFTYEKKVTITLADKSCIQAHTLKIAFNDSALSAKTDPKPTSPQEKTHSSGNNEKASQIKKITLQGNVRMQKGVQSVRADTVEINPATSLCNLEGNIVLKQGQKKKHHIPLVTKGDRGTLNLKTYHATLEGSEQSPISTTIHLGNRNKILSKNKKHEHNKNTSTT